MKRIYTLTIAIAAMAVIGLAMSAKPASAVHAGTGQGLVCGACHTMHSSQGNATMGVAGGTVLLLRAATAIAKYQIGDFCLACHAENGTSGMADVQWNTGVWATTPPKVYRTTAWTAGDFSTVGAGGDFSGSGAFAAGTFTNNAGDNTTGSGAPSAGRGHSINLQAADIMPPGSNSGVGGIENFTCTSCHDPHGVTATTVSVNRFRNLRGQLTDGGNALDWDTSGNIAASYVGAVGNTAQGGTNITLANNIWPVFRNAGSQNTYNGSDTAGLQFSRFCAQCHGDWHEDTVTGGIANNWATASDPTTGNFDWARHPVDTALVVAGSRQSSSSVTIVDKGHYDQTYNNLALGKKLPAANLAGGTDVYYGNDDTDKVFCLSCHFAHAGPYFDNLRWDYLSAVSAGGQTGLALNSDTGCQQCHNRGGTFGS